MEDILNTDQRPKLEDYENYMYIVARMISYNVQKNNITAEQVSIILGKDFVITFQEDDHNIFEPLKDRIRKGISLIKKMGPDFLVYTLLDFIVDGYFVVVEKLGDKIEFIEDTMVLKPNPKTLQNIHHLKREMLYLHKAIWPLREVVGALERRESILVREHTVVYLRDVYDHIIQLMDSIETYRDILSGMLDIYLSSVSNRMNEVMKVLAVFSAVFMPLTFLAGIYGMNFKYMPLLDWRLGYPTLWLVMIVIAILMLLYFRKKKWI
jgi:magnesium transporter